MRAQRFLVWLLLLGLVCTTHAAEQISPASAKAPVYTASNPLPIRVVEDEDKSKAHDAIEAANLDAQKTSADGTKRQADLALWSLLVSGGGLLISVVAGLYLIGTYHETKRTAKAAMDSVDVAAKAVELSRLAQRAWISFQNFNGVTLVKVDEKKQKVFDGLGIVMAFKNSGQTAALKVTMSTEHVYVDPKGPLPEFKRPAKGLIESIVIPGQTVTSGRIDFPAGRLKALERGDVHIYMYCLINYEDQFHPNIQRISETTLRMHHVGFDEEGVPRVFLRQDGKQNTFT